MRYKLREKIINKLISRGAEGGQNNGENWQPSIEMTSTPHDGILNF